jgi:hypothetical protein
MTYIVNLITDGSFYRVVSAPTYAEAYSIIMDELDHQDFEMIEVEK